ncbi:MAG: DNA polymerase I [Myxococcales bacterium]|nr:DNA polymerase I [Myxococcales bacterium]
MSTSDETLYLVDGSGFIFRAYYGIRAPMSALDGTPTNAVYGFTRLLLNVIRDREPTHIAVVFDPSGPSFRADLYPEYKANRTEPPDDLRPQFNLCREAVRALGIPALEVARYEADDVIGTLARRWNARADSHRCVIVTADKDMMQLVDERTLLWDGKEKETDREGVIERFGVPPERVIDVLGLAGDSSDNIPGVPGIGEKTAAKLLAEHDGMEALLAAASTIKGKRGENLQAFAEQARLSYRLATIETEAPLAVDFASLALTPHDPDVLAPFLRRLNFKRFLKEFKLEDHAIQGIDRSGYVPVLTLAELNKALGKIRKAGRLSFDLETTSLSTHDAELVGVALCWAPGEAVYVPVGHRYDGAPKQLAVDEVLAALKPLLEDWTLPKYGQNLKYEWQVLRKYGVELTGVAADSMLTAYLLDPNRQRYGIDELSLDLLEHSMISFSQVTGTKRPADHEFVGVDIADATTYAAEDADVALQLCDKLGPQLAAQPELDTLNRTLEVPLSELLSRMEYTGVRVDGDLLRAQSKDFGARLDVIEAAIYEAAGGEFTIDSPKQLGDILFDKLGLTPGKKTEKGARSTDAQVLRDLRAEHPLPGLILDYRHLSKLRSTYLDTLPDLIHPKTGRVHSNFRQAVAATGRISSSDPNLQNIPIKTDEGRQIRRAFITDPGWKLISADYSQVELRLLAHYAEADSLIDAFVNGIDIHTRTAADVFEVPLEKVTSDQRRQAKAINYGLMYGMSGHRLAAELGIDRREANAIRTRYFKTYAGVKRYLDQAVEEARETQATRTLFGRVRPLPDINARRWHVKQAAERLAINTPIQGSAADILKRAMLGLDAALRGKGLQARMVLTVHDELVLEAPEAEVDTVKALLRTEMEGAAKLRVPLEVEVGVGDSWAEIH